MNLKTEIVIEELTPKERKLYTQHVIGKTTCPYCKRKDIKVVNFYSGRGPKKYFLEDHKLGEGNEMCPGTNDWSYEVPQK